MDIIEWGVPQGSVLGPLLFLIFINDIPNASKLLTWLFADDTALMASATNLQLLKEIMNTEVAKVQAWLLANRLSVHYVKKSQYMLINKNNNTSIDGEEFELSMGGNIISRTKSYCYLGIIVDERLSWNEHINDLCNKLSQVSGTMFRIRKLLSRKALMLVYHSLVGSKLRYGLVCWATASKTLLNKINIIHNKIVTCMTFSKRCSRMWPLYFQLKVLPLDFLIQVEYGKVMFKFHKRLLPEVFDTYLQKPSHHHFTRFTSSNNLELFRPGNAKDTSILGLLSL